jgi:hypothetical protein
VAIQLDLTVGDITATLSAGYTHVKVYRSAQELVGFAEVTTLDSLIVLQAGISDYTFIDGTGTTEHWYRTTFFDINGVVAETAPSDAFLGSYTDTNFGATSYPNEFEFTDADYYKIDRIRILIGDPKSLTRDYVSIDTGYSSISIDGTTHTLSNPNGWPLKVVLDGTEYTSKEEPYVNDYQFITFSGTTISTVSGVLDVWYYNFRNSDAEILRVFNSLNPPIGLDADQVPFELAAVCAAIEILEAELRLFGVTSGSEVDIFQEIRINPKGGFDGRLKDLQSLYKRKEKLLQDVLDDNGGLNKDICGVLID